MVSVSNSPPGPLFPLPFPPRSRTNLPVPTLEHHHHHHDHPHGHSADPESETSSGAEYSSVCLDADHSPSENRPPKDPSKTTTNHHANHRHTQHSHHPPGRDLGMTGALLHVLSDALNNIGVIVAALVIWLTPSPHRFYADPAAGLTISLMILLSALPLVRHSGEILLQSAPRGVDLRDVKHDLETLPGVVSVHELHVWRLDQHKAVATAHVVVEDPAVTVAAFMEMARTIGECLHAYGIHSATLQPELAASVPPPPPAGEGTGTGGAGGGGAAAVPCQIVCGKGMCDHLMCCNTPVSGVREGG